MTFPCRCSLLEFAKALLYPQLAALWLFELVIADFREV